MNRLRLLPVLFLVLAWLAAPAFAADRAGMVVDVQGGARLVENGSARKLDLLAYVPTGARIEVDAGGQAAVSLYATRTVYRLTGPAVAEVRADGIHGVSGTPVAARALAQKLVASAQPGNRVHGAVRMRDVATDIALVAPAADAVLLAAPTTLRWDAVLPGPYTVAIAPAQSPQAPLATAEQADTFWTLPPLALQPGTTYRWTVTALHDGEPRTATGSFTLASPDVVELLDAIRPADDAAIEEWVLYAAVLREQGLHEDARATWARIAERRPDLAKARQLAR